MVGSMKLECEDSSRNDRSLIRFGIFSSCDGGNLVRYMSNVVQYGKSFRTVWWMVAVSCIWNKDLHHFLNFQNIGFGTYR